MKGKRDPVYGISKLTPAMRVVLEDMLFEKNLSCGEISEQSEAALGVNLSEGVVANYYNKLVQRRTIRHIVNSSKMANEVLKTFNDNPSDTYRAVLKLIGQAVFHWSVNSRKKLDIKSIRDLTELLISARREETAVKRFALEREKWEFDVVRSCQAHHKELQSISLDKSLDEEARLLAIRQRLFGGNLPD